MEQKSKSNMCRPANIYVPFYQFFAIYYSLFAWTAGPGTTLKSMQHMQRQPKSPSGINKVIKAKAPIGKHICIDSVHRPSAIGEMNKNQSKY